jgi:hypothetical protein
VGAVIFDTPCKKYHNYFTGGGSKKIALSGAALPPPNSGVLAA